MKEQVNRTIKINAGIACLDRANEVEPRPNEDRASAESPKSIAQGNALCNELHLSPSSPERAKSFVNNRLRSERRYVFNPVNLVNPINHGSDNMLDWLRRAPFRFGCFAEPVPNKVWGLAMTALWVVFLAFHTAFFVRQPIFNFQFSIRLSGGSRKSATKE